MKKLKLIAIKDPQLRKIRNEFRILLKLWASDVKNSLIQKDRFEEGPQIQIELSRLSLMESLSICNCLHCGNSDKDMIFRPDMKQWLCIECNSELTHFAKLRKELQMGVDEIYEFFQKLSGEEGVNLRSLHRSNIKCGGQAYPLSKDILNQMGVKPKIQKQFLDLCRHYGGYCDCEIVFNALPKFLN